MPNRRPHNYRGNFAETLPDDIFGGKLYCAKEPFGKEQYCYIEPFGTELYSRRERPRPVLITDGTSNTIWDDTDIAHVIRRMR